MHCAAVAGQEEAIQMLVTQHGLDVRAKDKVKLIHLAIV